MAVYGVSTLVLHAGPKGSANSIVNSAQQARLDQTGVDAPTEAAVPSLDDDDWDEEGDQFQSAEPVEKPGSRDGDAVLDSGGSDDWDSNFQDASTPAVGAADPANSGSVPGPPSGQGQAVSNLDDAHQASLGLRETVEPGGSYEALPGLAESQNLILQVCQGSKHMPIRQC